MSSIPPSTYRLVHPEHQAFLNGGPLPLTHKAESLHHLETRLLRFSVRTASASFNFIRSMFGFAMLIPGLTLVAFGIFALFDQHPNTTIQLNLCVGLPVTSVGLIFITITYGLLAESLIPLTRVKLHYTRLIRFGRLLHGTIIGIEELDSQIYLVYEFKTPQNQLIVCRYKLTDSPHNPHEWLNAHVCILYLSPKINIIL